jgi:hypothetical protein
VKNKMRIFNLSDSILLRAFYTKAGVPQTGKTVTVTVYNENNLASPLVSSHSCAESSHIGGYYLYNWVHSLEERSELVVMYDIDGRRLMEHVLVEVDMVKEIDNQDADDDGIAL